jgi:hypothetical protein
MWLKRLFWFCLILVVLLVAAWIALPYILELAGVPPTGTGRQDLHVMLDGQGNPTEPHVRLKKGYGVILNCVGQIVSPPGRYRLKITVDGRVILDRVVRAGQPVTYRVFTKMSLEPTRFVHQIWAKDDQRYVKVTYVFDYTYTYKSVFNRLLGLEKPPPPVTTAVAGTRPAGRTMTTGTGPAPTAPIKPRREVRQAVPPPAAPTPPPAPAALKPPALPPAPSGASLPFMPWEKAD